MFKKILVPLDGSSSSESALDSALFFAENCGAELLLVRTPVLRHPLLDGVEQEEKHAWGVCHTYLQQVALRFNSRFTITTRVLPRGPVAESLLEAAQSAACQLIIMTSHGRSGVSRAVAGSVAEQVARAAPCPTMILGRNVPAVAAYRS